MLQSKAKQVAKKRRVARRCQTMMSCHDEREGWKERVERVEGGPKYSFLIYFFIVFLKLNPNSTLLRKIFSYSFNYTSLLLVLPFSLLLLFSKMNRLIKATLLVALVATQLATQIVATSSKAPKAPKVTKVPKAPSAKATKAPKAPSAKATKAPKVSKAPKASKAPKRT